MFRDGSWIEPKWFGQDETSDFSPNAAMLGDCMLMATPTIYSHYVVGLNKLNFNDLAETAWYIKAVKFGISEGVGNNMFEPKREITRQEMFTLLYNALKIIDRLPKQKLGKKLSDFTDAE